MVYAYMSTLGQGDGIRIHVHCIQHWVKVMVYAYTSTLGQGYGKRIYTGKGYGTCMYSTLGQDYSYSSYTAVTVTKLRELN